MSDTRDFKFITPERYEEEIKKKYIHGPNGWLLFVACNQGIELADKVKKEYDKLLVEGGSECKEVPILNDTEERRKTGDVTKYKKLTEVFEDGETRQRLPYSVDGSHSCVFQSVHEQVSGHTPNENLWELYSMIRTLKDHGAITITAVTLYSPYSRQDKPTSFKREATLSKLVTDCFVTAGVNRVLMYHPHSEGIVGFYEPNARVVKINGLDLFIEIMKPFKGREDVVCVSTDAGSAKSTIHFAKALGVDYAICSKYRPEKDNADLIGMIGKTENKKIAIIADDETVTLSSIYNVSRVLVENKGIQEIYVLVSHNKLQPKYVPKLVKMNKEFGLKEFHFTDTIPQSQDILSLPFVKVHSLAPRMALILNRMHYNQSVSELFYKPRD